MKEEFFSINFLENGSGVQLELQNTTDQTFRSIEMLTVFLKDEVTPGGGPSRTHIKFEDIKSLQPQEKAILHHKTWVDGKPVGEALDQLARLKAVEGEAKPYVLDISWQDADGKTRYQRIPVGH